ncbi:MAG: YkgJ family cysteine cluster protein [Deltaproteobacteria bacterium]|nr:YkgJ family cysteine cluster protein [Deltaproteobacteria bacterium]MDQ3295651.1 YkgJ family cysteine cluster protein [Myxococcota bacterium]
MALRLRDELELQAASDGSGGTLLDPLFTRTVTLGPTGVAVARKLDGTREPPRLIAELVEAGFVRATIEDSLRCLTLLQLIDGIGDGVRDRVRAIWAGEIELEPRTLPDTRFACQGSGMCCRSYRLGPITADEVASISALPLRASFADLPDGELFVRHDDKQYLRRVDSGCVFLQPDERCGLHARFGEAAKPSACRSYPVAAKLTFEAAVLYNNQQCASHFVSQDRGPALIESAHLIRTRLSGPLTLFHPIVFVREDTPVDYAHFLVLEGALRQVVADGAPFRQLAYALEICDSFVAAARTFPLGSDPAVAFAAWRASIAIAADPPPPPSPADWDAALAALELVVDELASFLANVEHADPGDRDMAPLIVELLPGLELLRERARERPSSTPALPVDIAAALRTSLVQGFQGQLSLPEDRPLAAIGQAALAIAAGFAGAQRTGGGWGIAELGRGHALANRVLPPFTSPMFRQHPERARGLVAALAALCGS